MNERPKPIPTGRVTFEEFLEWCDEDTHAEWVDGQIILLGAPPLVLERPVDVEGIGFEEFLVRFDGIHAEWDDGRVSMMSPASDDHQNIRDFLIAVIRLHSEFHQTGWVRSSPFLMRLPNKPAGREPDLLYLASEHDQRIRPTFLDGPADLVVEIISPESDERDRGTKFVEYEAAGVREYWLIDPLRHEAMFYQLDAHARYRPGQITDGIYHSIVLAGFWLRVEWLWQRPLPKVLSVLKELGVL